MRQYFNHPIGKFIIYFAALYILWFLLYDLWLHPWGKLDEAIVANTIYISEKILQFLGYTVYTDGGRVIAIAGSSGLFVGDACNSLTLIALFTGFVIAFPAPLNKKWKFALFGIATIYFINIIRVVALAIIETYSRAWTEFNHSYTFNFLMYGYIFYLWYYWVNKLTGKKQPNNVS